MADRRIRVLHLITRMVLGGAQENTLLTASGLDPARYDVTLASGPTSGPEGSLEDRIPAGLKFARVPDLVRDPDPIRDLRAFAQVRKLIRRGRYDIVHTHTTKAGLLGRIAAWTARTPVVVHTPHGHAFHSFLNTAGSAALVWVERAMARRTDRIICLTDAEREDHLAVRVGRPEQFEIVHSGVDIARFQRSAEPAPARAALGIPPDAPLIVCVARLAPVKGVRYLVEAMPRVRCEVPNATAVIVGDGPLRPELERLTDELGLGGAVVWLGLRKDIPAMMRLATVVVLPSLNEGMGRVVVEAFAAGRPVIGSRVSGIPDLIRDGETGLLAPPGDSAALAAAIVRCLKAPQWTARMGEQAARAADEFSVDRMVAKIDAVYGRLLGGRPSSTRLIRCGGRVPSPDDSALRRSVVPWLHLEKEQSVG